MQFPLYLTSEGKQILDMVAKAHFNIRENISGCIHVESYKFIIISKFMVNHKLLDCLAIIKAAFSNLISSQMHVVARENGVEIGQCTVE